MRTVDLNKYSFDGLVGMNTWTPLREGTMSFCIERHRILWVLRIPSTALSYVWLYALVTPCLLITCSLNADRVWFYWWAAFPYFCSALLFALFPDLSSSFQCLSPGRDRGGGNAHWTLFSEQLPHRLFLAFDVFLLTSTLSVGRVMGRDGCV